MITFITITIPIFLIIITINLGAINIIVLWLRDYVIYFEIGHTNLRLGWHGMGLLCGDVSAEAPNQGADSALLGGVMSGRNQKEDREIHQ